MSGFKKQVMTSTRIRRVLTDEWTCECEQAYAAYCARKRRLPKKKKR